MSNLANAYLRRAISSLGAIEVASGRYVYLAEDLWHSVSSDALVTAVAQADGESQPDPSACLGDGAIPMPPWWSPAEQFLHLGFDGKPAEIGDDVARVITADLETGKEHPAPRGVS